MARIRHLSIRRFRGLAHLDWAPVAGVNALIGSGDVGKSTLLDGVALTLSATRREVFYDTDFCNLDADVGFEIRVTLGDLPAELRDLERYSDYLRGWNAATDTLEDEPSAICEDAMTLQLRVGASLEGEWSLYSDRTQGQESRDLSLPHRALIAPIVLDQSPATHLRWSRQSILQRLATPQVGVRTLVAQAARSLRENAQGLGDPATDAVLEQVRATGQELGIEKAQQATVQLDAFGIPGWNASLALHDGNGVPLRCLGAGSASLLVAGLFRTLLAPGGIALVDEVEHGLEPHRLGRLLKLLGAGTGDGPQVFVTTHSPVVVCELSVHELAVLRFDPQLEVHEVRPVRLTAPGQNVQGVIRACANALLAKHVIVCEGATEIGLLRGLDQFWSNAGLDSFALCGVALTNGAGIPQAVERANTFSALGYRTLLVMDSDRPLMPDQLQACQQAATHIIEWGGAQATEDALFTGLAWLDVLALLNVAEATWTTALLETNLRSHSVGRLGLDDCRSAETREHRELLALTAKRQAWFKRIDFGEQIGRDVLGPALLRASAALQAIFQQLRTWVDDG